MKYLLRWLSNLAHAFLNLCVALYFLAECVVMGWSWDTTFWKDLD